MPQSLDFSPCQLSLPLPRIVPHPFCLLSCVLLTLTKLAEPGFPHGPGWMLLPTSNHSVRRGCLSFYPLSLTLALALSSARITSQQVPGTCPATPVLSVHHPPPPSVWHALGLTVLAVAQSLIFCTHHTEHKMKNIKNAQPRGYFYCIVCVFVHVYPCRCMVPQCGCGGKGTTLGVSPGLPPSLRVWGHSCL